MVSDVDNLIHIPSVMDHQGWFTASSLMQQWFNRPPSIAPLYTDTERSIVTMNWILGFKRAREIYESMLEQRVWANDAAKKVISTWLQRQGFRDGRRHEFGDFHLDDAQLTRKSRRINYRDVSYGIEQLGGLDELVAAMGRFTLDVVVSGEISAAGQHGKQEVTIDNIGIYARDSYDFERGSCPGGMYGECPVK